MTSNSSKISVPAKSTTSSISASKTYTDLLKAVRGEIALGKQRALDAVERERVRTAWQTGQLILSHVLLNKDRAKYGAQVIERLSKDIGISKRELQYMVEFARAYPIVRTSAQLSWSHYQALLGVNDEARRDHITDLAIKNDWPVKTLRAEIQKLKAVKKPAAKNLPEVLPSLPAPVPGVYRHVMWKGKPAWDLGFQTYFEIKGQAVPKENPPAEALYAYSAEIESVVDGDTFWALVELGFGVGQRHRFRLRMLNAPEINTREGIEARKVLLKFLKPKTQVLIRTTKTDQYGRYLADVWVKGTALDGLLLQSGYFTRRS